MFAKCLASSGAHIFAMNIFANCVLLLVRRYVVMPEEVRQCFMKRFAAYVAVAFDVGDACDILEYQY